MGAPKLYESFHGERGGRRFETGIKFGRRWLTPQGALNIIIPEGLTVVGHCAAIEYDTRRDGRAVLARHEFAAGSRPYLMAGDAPGQLFLVGTRYKFTSRGIMDIDSNGRLIDGGLDK